MMTMSKMMEGRVKIWMWTLGKMMGLMSGDVLEGAPDDEK